MIHFKLKLMHPNESFNKLTNKNTLMLVLSKCTVKRPQTDTEFPPEFRQSPPPPEFRQSPPPPRPFEIIINQIQSGGQNLQDWSNIDVHSMKTGTRRVRSPCVCRST